MTAVVWITGASSGIGAALATSVPFAATVVNVSRRPLAGVEHLAADLSDPAAWRAVGDDFTRRLATPGVDRALLIHSAVYQPSWGFAGEQPVEEQHRQVLVNAGAPLALGDAFLRACPPGLDAGIVLVSSGGAAHATPGASVYCASKAGIEHWLRVVAAERAIRGHGPWVLGIRPGRVDTPGMRITAAAPAEDFPFAPALATLAAGGEVAQAEAVAKTIWGLIEGPVESGATIDVGAA